MIKTLLSGYTGKIGKKIKKIKSKKFLIKYFIRKNSKNFCKKIKNCEIVIDFSVPLNTLKILYYCLKFKKKIIIGTTGFNKKEKKLLKNSSKYIPIFFDYNFNKNFHIYLLILKFSSFFFKKKNSLLIETHNYKKKDKPSGSYYKICKFLNLKFPFISKRIGDEKGTHELLFYDKYNLISIKHKIFSRNSILLKLEYIITFLFYKKIGLYNMDNI
ncbi:dihydrodipicolinate reductase C-terminal domain-containing protein [Candidatus Vidania fulgoroideorum]